jgi:hypothetical protein
MCEFCQHDPCQCDLDQNSPVDVDADTWSRIYADPNYDMNHDHGMDY